MLFGLLLELHHPVHAMKLIATIMMMMYDPRSLKYLMNRRQSQSLLCGRVMMSTTMIPNRELSHLHRPGHDEVIAQVVGEVFSRQALVLCHDPRDRLLKIGRDEFNVFVADHAECRLSFRIWC
jgi:hypothetical protein